MKAREIDWRKSSTARIFQALSDALREAHRDFDHAQEEYLADDIQQYAENLFGIAFVAAQVYVAGTISDAIQLAGSKAQLTKDRLLREYSDPLAD